MPASGLGHRKNLDESAPYIVEVSIASFPNTPKVEAVLSIQDVLLHDLLGVNEVIGVTVVHTSSQQVDADCGKYQAEQEVDGQEAKDLWQYCNKHLD